MNNVKKVGEAHIDYTCLLGSGANSDVYKCWLEKDDSRYYAAKVLRIPKLSDKLPQYQDFLTKKTNLLAQHQHPNIVSFEKIYLSSTSVHLIMELCDTSLDKLKGKLQRKEILKYVHEIAGALHFLSKLNHIHRDVKPSNILVKENVAKLADFDLIREMKNPAISEALTQQQGTLLYMAPEVYEENAEYNYKCDVWSLGMSLFELLYDGRFPWKKEVKNQEWFQNIRKVPLEFEENDRVLKDLLENMLRVDIDERFEWDEVYFHEAFEEFIR